MNVKLITKALHILSLLSEEDVATVMNLRALSEDERELLITVLEPQKATTKRAGKKGSKGGSSKSPRAQSLSGAIQRTPKSKVDDDDGDDDSDGKGMSGPLCQACGNFRQYQDHFKPSPNYHEFDAGKSSNSTAQPARGKSSTNGGAGSEADLGGERLDAIRAASGE